MFRYFNETLSVRAQRPAVSWSQSVLQQPGSRSAAQTMRERWDIEPLPHYADPKITFSRHQMWLQSVTLAKVSIFGRLVSLCR